MRYGYFDDGSREYVITQPDTPLPWINYLGSEAYFGIISNTAGGYSFYKDARLRRITRYRYNNAPLDVGGRYIYIRDDQAAKPDYWSPTWQPTRKTLESVWLPEIENARQHPRGSAADRLREVWGQRPDVAKNRPVRLRVVGG